MRELCLHFFSILTYIGRNVVHCALSGEDFSIRSIDFAILGRANKEKLRICLDDALAL